MVSEKNLSEVLGGVDADVAVDVYRRNGRAVAMSFWGRGAGPLAFFKAIDGVEGLVRSALLGNDDVPAYDKRESLLGQRIVGASMAANRLIAVQMVGEDGSGHKYSCAAPEASADVNFLPLVDALAVALGSLEGGAVQDSASMLQAISREWLERNVQFSQSHPARNVVEATALLARDALAGKEGVEGDLRAYVTKVSGCLPDFRIVLLDETDQWTDQDLVSRAGTIWSAYLYDANRVVHLAEITPSYELEYLYCTAESELPDGDQETLVAHGRPEDGSIYMHCRDVDRIDWSRKHACGMPTGREADSYRELVDAEVEQYVCNLAIDVPRPLTDQTIAQHAVALLSTGSDNAEDVARLLDAFSPAVRQEIAAYESSASLEGALRSYLDGVSARREFASELAQENVSIEGARLASRFHREVLEHFETLGSIGEQYGQRTVADLFYLQTAILRGGELDVWPQSSIMNVVEKLPSAEKWLSYTKPCNKYGEPSPRHDVSDVMPVMR